MITITSEEAKVIVGTYLYLMELENDYAGEIAVRPAERAIFDKLREATRPPGVPAASMDHVRNLPTPPPSKFEDAEYDPT